MIESINYESSERDINKISFLSAYACTILLLGKSNFKRIKRELDIYLNWVQELSWTEERTKIMKEMLMKDKHLLANQSTTGVREGIEFGCKSLRLIHHHLIRIPSLNEVVINNYMMSLIRVYEFPMVSDKKLQNYNIKLKTLIQKGEIPLLDTEKCPYKEPLSSSWVEDIKKNDKYIQEYNLREKKTNHVNGDDVLRAIYLFKLILSKDVKCPPQIEKYIQHFQDLRKHPVAKTMMKSHSGMDPNMAMSKHSGSNFNQFPAYRSLVFPGINSISNVLGNFIIPEKDKDNFNWGNFINYEGFIFPESCKRVCLAAGKGDTWKLRIMGQAFPAFQNYCQPLAKCFEEVGKFHTRDYRRRKSMSREEILRWEEEQKDQMFIATYDQTSRFTSLIKNSRDAFGTDFSNYSDYLSRNVFRFILDDIMDLPIILTDNIMSIMSFPILSDRKEYKIPYGSLAGIISNFGLITECNLLMAVIAFLVYESKYPGQYTGSFEIIVCGDDKVILSDTKFPLYFIEILSEVESFTNCIGNVDKTEGWGLTNFVSFCKISYDSLGRPISGLSGNSFLKSKLAFRDFNQLLKNLEKSGIIEYISDLEENINEAIEICLENIISFYKRKDSKIDVKKRIDNFRKVPYEWGGLDISGKYDFSFYLQSLYNFLSQITYEPLERIGKDLELLINNGLHKSEMFARLYINSNAGDDLSLILQEIQDIQDQGDFSIRNILTIRSIRAKIQKVIDYWIASKNGQKSVSTKDRKNLIGDPDSIFDDSPEENTFPINNLVQEYLRKGNAESREKLAKINQVNNLKVKYKAEEASYGRGLYPCLYFPGKDIKVRLVDSENSYYHGADENIFNVEDALISPEERELVYLVKKMREDAGLEQRLEEIRARKNRHIQEILESEVQRRIREEFDELSNGF